MICEATSAVVILEHVVWKEGLAGQCMKVRYFGVHGVSSPPLCSGGCREK